MRRIFVLAILVVCTVAATPATAQLYLSQDSNANGLYVLNTATGAATLVGSGITNVSSSTVGLAPGATPGTLYGSLWSDIAVIQTDGSGSTTLPGNAQAEGLAYDAGGNVLYGIINTGFFTINQATGDVAATLASAPVDLEGIDWDSTRGRVLGIGDGSTLYSYNPGTDSWSIVGDTGISWSAAGLAYDPGSDTLYAVGAGDNNLYRINPTTAVPTLIGATGINAEGGLAFVGPAVLTTSVPTASEYGLAALGLMLAVAGFFALRLRG